MNRFKAHLTVSSKEEDLQVFRMVIYFKYFDKKSKTYKRKI